MASRSRKPTLELQIPAPDENPMLLPLIDFNWHFQSIVSPSGSSSASQSPVLSPRGSSEQSEEECLRDEFLRVFQAIDENGDGLISKEEVGKLMAKLGHGMSDSDLELLMLTVDLNGDGCVDFEEFQALYITSVEGGRIDGGGGVGGDGGDGAESSDSSSSSFSSLANPRGEEDEEENLRDAFRVFDQNGDGFITAEELHRVLSRLGFIQGARSIAACKNMIRGVDSNGDGLVDFLEFKNMMLERPSPRSYFATMIEAN
ncbi:probable calcium-binding protein CML17 [Selaginella moellendorffii]|uniref:probable calcium-binding protein CML17 n=1 Tax=Selaginella moellendorffii TaxID=88036 RepID=UPI000D1C89AD|nr:probable calcium-binding protein CML17 [Selaginella moellendorffii]|eukprot:XP_024539516.1 probable calcium-binding protein CML17 [Selaginella moellendorffii]